MKTKKLVVVNLLGGPGSGKSTAAAGVFYKLKKLQYNVELVTEFVKDRIYEGVFGCIEDQIYIFGQQQRRLGRLVEKVDIAVTDSPIILSCLYAKIESPTFKKLVKEVHNRYTNINFFLNRGEIPFTERGRLQNLEQSKKLDLTLKHLLQESNIDYYNVDVTTNLITDIVEKIEENIQISSLKTVGGSDG